MARPTDEPRMGTIPRDRHIDAVWQLDDNVDAVLSCGHSKDRKQFYASLNVRRNTDGGWTTMPFEATVVYRAHVARYSDKALVAFMHEALEVMRRDLSGHPDVLKHFDPATVVAA